MYEYNLLEERLNSQLPEELFQILETYGGLSIEENSFLDRKNQKEWTLASFLKFSDIYNYFEDIEEELKFAELNIKLLSFAYENAGWRFCISTEKNNPVYIFKTSNYSGKEAFEKISPSFIEFINELRLPDNKN